MKTIMIPLLAALALIALFPSCAQKSPKKTPRDLPEAVTLLKLNGFNVMPTWINDGEILYHSSLRERHKDFQIYRYKLGDTESKRVTFHDGSTESAFYSPSERSLYYSSTTDEEKELSSLIERYQQKTPPAPEALNPSLTLRTTEIYRSGLDGSSIQRLTSHKGFDGRVHINPHNHRVLFSSLRQGHLQIFSMSPTGKELRQLTTSAGHSMDVQYAPDQRRYYWIEIPGGENLSRILSADQSFRNHKPLSLPRGYYSSVKYVPGRGLLLSAQIEGFSREFDIFFYRDNGSCLLSLLSAPGHQLTPEASPDGSKITFVHQHNGQSQIALMDFDPPEGPCLGPPGEIDPDNRS